MQKIASILAGIVLVLSSHAQAAILYDETFSVDGPIGDYTGPGKIFTAYSATNNYFAQATGGVLNMGLPAEGEGTPSGLLYTYTSLGSARSLLSMQFDFTMLGGGAADSAFGLYIGSYANIDEFAPGWNVHEGARNWTKINASAGASYAVTAQDGTNTNHTDSGLLAGQTYTWNVFLNQSGADELYIGPDGGSHLLENNSWSLFVDNVLVADSVPKGNAGSTGSINGIVFILSKNYYGGSSNMNVDNLIIRDDLNMVPEPSAVALLALGGMAVMARRRRR